MYATQAKDCPKSGDTVLLYAGKGRITKLTLAKGETYCHHFGAFRHDDIIGRLLHSLTGTIDSNVILFIR